MNLFFRLSIWFGTIFFSLIINSTCIYAVTPTKLLDTSQGTYYQNNSGASAKTYVGAWTMASDGTKLFLGWSKTAPDYNNSGTFLSYYDSGTDSFTKIMDLPEQDIYRMKVFDNVLYIPGLDPTDQAWDAGDLFMIDTGDLSETRLTYRYDTDHFVDATTTDANGNFSFTGLRRIPYRLKFIKPANYIFTTQQVTSDRFNIIDSNPNSSGYYIQCSSGNEGFRFSGSSYTDDTIDAGLRSSSGAAAGTETSGTTDNDYYDGDMTIGDKVWLDSNNNGKQDSGESGVANVRVELYTRDPYFPCAIHSSAIYVEDDGTIYLDYGYNYRDTEITEVTGYNAYLAQFGNVLVKSTDGGSTWQVVDSSQHNKKYFSGDLIKLNNTFYRNLTTQGAVTLTNDGNEDPDNPGTFLFEGYYPYNISYSSDGSTWTTNSIISSSLFSYSSGLSTYRYYQNPGSVFSSLIPFRNKVLVSSREENEILNYTNGEQNSITTDISQFGDIISDYSNPLNAANITDDTNGMDQRFNSMVAIGEYLYAIGKDNKLYLSSNIRHWTEVADFSSVDSGDQMIALYYWPEQDWLMISTAGSTGSIYYITHQDVVDTLIKISAPESTLLFLDPNESTLDYTNTGTQDSTDVRILNSESVIISEVNTNFSGSDLDWSMVVAETSVTNGKSYIANLNQADGVASTHTLYIPIPSTTTSNQVELCPHAMSLGDVFAGCREATIFENGETKIINNYSVTASKTTIGAVNYWVLTNLTGTGGISLVDTTSIPTTNSCGDLSINGSVELFEVRANSNSATLYFTPYNQATGYNIYYGPNAQADTYGTSFLNSSTGVIKLDIDYLSPNSQYYFKVQPVRGCSVGTVSNVLNLRTTNSLSYFNYAYLYTSSLNTSQSKFQVKSAPILIEEVPSHSNKATPEPVLTVSDNPQSTDSQLKQQSIFTQIYLVLVNFLSKVHLRN